MRTNGWTFACVFTIMFFTGVMVDMLIEAGAFR